MERLWEVDSARGIAIIMMLISNFITDLLYFKIYNPGSLASFWNIFALTTASMFILLVGISLSLSYSKVRDKPIKSIFRKYAIRGLKIFLWGLAITAVTMVFMNSDFILFGVLHLIGISIILSVPFLRFRKLFLFLGAIFIILGIYLNGLTFDFPWLLWLGFMPKGFSSVDYFPIFPWFGIILLGLSVGNMIYPDGKKRIKNVNNMFVKGLSFLGRNSLKIYLVHQPIFIGLLYLFIL